MLAVKAVNSNPNLKVIVTGCLAERYRSQIEEEITEPTGHFGLMTTTAIIVPDWVAREKGLQQVNQDEDTLDLFGGAT